MSYLSKPARFSRRDFLLGSGALIAAATTVGLSRPPDEPTSGLDVFMLVSQTLSAAPLDRAAGLAFYSALHHDDPRFADNLQTLAWLLRRHPEAGAVGLIGLLESSRQLELCATLGRMIDVWTAHLGATPALADARAQIDRLAAAEPSSS
jgi:hypothetical protein